MTPDEQKRVEELKAENAKLLAQLEDAKASDAESLKLFRAARDRADAAILRNAEWKQAMIEILKAPNNSFAEAAARERAKNLIHGEPKPKNPECECGRPAHEHGGCRNYRPKGA